MVLLLEYGGGCRHSDCRRCELLLLELLLGCCHCLLLLRHQLLHDQLLLELLDYLRVQLLLYGHSVGSEGCCRLLHLGGGERGEWGGGVELLLLLLQLGGDNLYERGRHSQRGGPVA